VLPATRPTGRGPWACCCLLFVFFAPCIAADDAKEKAVPNKKDKVIAIVGGDVYTITREVIRGGTVLVKDGKILRVGQDLAIPEGATVLDAKGKYVTPGFVALSMSGVGLRAAGAGGGVRGGGPGGGAGRTTDKLADTL